MKMNTKVNREEIELDKIELEEVFYHKEGKLYLAKDRGNIKQFKKDSQVGTTSEGYLTTRFKNYSAVKVHRIIYTLVYGNFNRKLEVDHKDQNRSNNLPSNLRLVEQNKNKKNKSLQINNSSGCLGVSYRRDTDKWRAEINVDGGKIPLGSFRKLGDAIKARKEAEKKYGYHENHGKITNKNHIVKSGYPGVSYRRDSDKWRVVLFVDSRKYSLGSFESLKEAIEVRKEAEVEYGFNK